MTNGESSNQRVALTGVPFDAYSSFLKGAAQGPTVFRQLLLGGSANSSTELGLDLKQWSIKDTGDLSWDNDESAFAVIKQHIHQQVSAAAKPLVIGGDHSISYPVLQGLGPHYSDLTILHFDAHPDLYDEFKGNRLSHACPFARIMEDGLASKLVQVGIRTLNAHQRSQAEKFNVDIHPMHLWQGPEQLNITGPVYISVDLDVLDPAFAPGVSHIEPGGMSVRQVLDVIQRIEGPVVGADIVEYNPTRDINHMTAMVAIKLYKELCAKLLTT